MGEISAKNLRGESMTDVIFNGANTRKPVGQAVIELQFDNAAGRLTGEYASYSEISLKRQVSRDGQSSYFLNGVKCRRKDITNIFLGTGLGPRSYSIIEQGMISQLIEAKPEDLRVYIEEAAGISRYKERRKETERRISHTRDNLDRLHDLREELQRQLHHLERQARAAEKYTEYKQEERTVKAQLQGLRWQELDAQANRKKTGIDELETERQARIAEQRSSEAELAEKRQLQQQFSDDIDEVQRNFYDQGTDIARLEEMIQHQSERAKQLNSDSTQTDAELVQVQASLRKDEQQMALFTNQLEQLQPQQKQLSESEQQSLDKLASTESEVSHCQQEWEAFNREVAEWRQAGEIQQSRIALLEDSIERTNVRLRVLAGDIERISGQSTEQEVAPLEAMLSTQEDQLKRIEAEISELLQALNQSRVENEQIDIALNEKRHQQQNLTGRLSSLEALQEAALGQSGEEHSWLESQGLGEKTRLAEVLKVIDGWETAVETVLGENLQAIVVEDIEPLVRVSESLQKGAVTLLSDSREISRQGNPDAQTLASVVEVSTDLDDWLEKVYLAESLETALELSRSVPAGCSVITRSGLWLGHNWFRLSRDHDMTSGVLQRQTELSAINFELQDVRQEISALEAEATGGMELLKQIERDREAQQMRLAEQQRAYGETRARLTARKAQTEKLAIDLTRAEGEAKDSQEQKRLDLQQLSEARNLLQTAMDEMEANEIRETDISERRASALKQLETVRKLAQMDREASHSLALQWQNLTAQMDSLRQAMHRLNEQLSSLELRKTELQKTLREMEAPRSQLQEELDVKLKLRSGIQGELSERRKGIEEIEFEIRAMEQKRLTFEAAVDLVRSTLEAARLEFQTLDVKRSSIEEQLRSEDIALTSVLDEMPADASEVEWSARLTRVENRIQRLGAINLAAIDEFKIQADRKDYLDAQNEDLEKALTTLVQAIRKIDVETRTRFKETFDLVNTKLQQLFPKLFGGGHAYLEMTGEDLLDTGVGLMARPPGKRNSSIHLLSGGEKALAAIALVFSIFSLNPAPFCLLDEVDAPLDDVNVQRYSDLVKEMSRTVQFIFITHNKVAMEMADQLMGVTMHEPGVSRLVSVDVEEAVAMAAV
jgi:chromosome segregation protein